LNSLDSLPAVAAVAQRSRLEGAAVLAAAVGDR
jgi:hypothetical protein